MTPPTSRRLAWITARSVVRPPGTLGDLGALLSAVGRLQAVTDESSLVRRAVEVARSHIGLERVGVFLVDPTQAHMLGSWATELRGQIVDEHHVRFPIDQSIVDVFHRAESGGQPFTVLDAPVVPKANRVQLIRRGWIACTPIRSPRARIGIMYNDAGQGRAPVDDCKQARAALLCTALGSAIELARALPQRVPAALPLPRHPSLRRAIGMLSRDPTLDSRELATSAGTSQRQLSFLFRSELGVSLPTYRNRLRIERLQTLLDKGKHSLADAARSVGFGSYAQFHRVFCATYGVAPRDYVRAAAHG